MSDTTTTVTSEELDLVRRVGLGDEVALAEIYDRHATRLYGVACRVLGDRTLAEDVVQEVFTWLWERSTGFEPDRGRLGPWLNTIAYRRAVDAVRREVVRRAVAQSPPPDHPSAEDVVIEATIAGRVRAAVDDLPDRQRDVVRLLYFEGSTVSELARNLGMAEGTAKTRLRQARRILAERLGDEGLVTMR